MPHAPAPSSGWPRTGWAPAGVSWVGHWRLVANHSVQGAKCAEWHGHRACFCCTPPPSLQPSCRRAGLCTDLNDRQCMHQGVACMLGSGVSKRAAHHLETRPGCMSFLRLHHHRSIDCWCSACRMQNVYQVGPVNRTGAASSAAAAASNKKASPAPAAKPSSVKSSPAPAPPTSPLPAASPAPTAKPSEEKGKAVGKKN